MAFTNITYQSNFYNFHKKLVSVKLYKDGYAGAIKYIRTQAVGIEVNYQDDNTPIIGTGAKVSFVNQGSFNDYDDLLTAYEKTWKCTIEYNGSVVFEGVNVCDLNEQEILNNGIITVQFTNYLRRLEDNYLISLAPSSLNTRMLTLIHEALGNTGFTYNLYINSTLFEEDMTDSDTDSFIHQTFIENDIFYSNWDEYESTYNVINKILKPFGAFLFAYGTKWIIERIENVGRTGDWLYYVHDSLTGVSCSSLKQEINKQDGDFKYIGVSQVFSYNSGLKTLKINLVEKKFNSLVASDFDADTIISKTLVSNYPLGGTMTPKSWYYEENLTGLTNGTNYIGITQWFHFVCGANTATWAMRGIYNIFYVQFNAPSDPTTLNISYKINCNVYDKTAIKSVLARFFIRINSGAKIDYFITEDPNSGVLSLGLAGYTFTVEVKPDKNGLMSVDVTTSIELTSAIQSDLGFPKIQDFIIGFLPSLYTSYANVQTFATDNYVGDMQITMNANEVNNEITSTINQNFIKTENEDLALFDLDDINYSNGFQLSTGEKTSVWSSTAASASETLVDLYIKDKFRKYSKILHIIKATILADLHIKPFAILTDDNIVSDESIGSLIKFVVTKYSWDLVNGIYSGLEAEEYPDTDIIITE